MSMNCDHCQATMINGVLCHEHGCPNTNSRYDADARLWVRQTTCFECGCLVDCDSRGRYECDCQGGES